jgi:hypothetical protein
MLSKLKKTICLNIKADAKMLPEIRKHFVKNETKMLSNFKNNFIYKYL